MKTIEKDGKLYYTGDRLLVVEKDVLPIKQILTITNIIDDEYCNARFNAVFSNNFVLNKIIRLSDYQIYKTITVGMTLMAHDTTQDQFGIVLPYGHFEVDVRSKYPLSLVTIRYEECNTNIINVILSSPLDIITNDEGHRLISKNVKVLSRARQELRLGYIKEVITFRIPWETNIFIRPSTEWLV